MRRIYFLLVFIVTIVIACKGKNKTPSGILPQKKMQAVLWDVMRADQFVVDYRIRQDSTLDRLKESLRYYEQIFAIHQISKEDFDRSFEYYKTRPDQLRAIMDSIAANANLAPTAPITPAPVSIDTAPTQRLDF